MNIIKIFINDVEKEEQSLNGMHIHDRVSNAVERAKDIYHGRAFTKQIYGSFKKRVNVKLNGVTIYRISDHSELYSY
jgi:hypothetical protein